MAALARVFVALQFGTGVDLQVFPLNSNADIEGTSVSSATVVAVAIVRRADHAGIAELDAPAEARRFKMLIHLV